MGSFLVPFPVQVPHRSEQWQGLSLPSSRWKAEAKKNPPKLQALCHPLNPPQIEWKDRQK